MTFLWLSLVCLLSILPFVWALSSPSSTSTQPNVDLKNDQYQAHLRAKIAGSIAKGERRAQERSAQLRPVCGQCARPDTLCVCDVLPAEKLPTQTNILILQHPNERRKKNLSTVPLLKLALQSVQVVVGYTFEPESLSCVLDSLEQGQKPLLLYPSEEAISLDDNESNVANSAFDENVGIKSNNNLLIIMDGTWTEAKRMVRGSPRLVDCCQPVQFSSEASSIYDALRSEPEAHCLSTLEACARALLLLEPDPNVVVQENLHKVLQAHVDAHLANARIMAPRFVGASKHKLSDKNIRRREIELTLLSNSRAPNGQEDAPDSKEIHKTFVWQRLPDGTMVRSLQPSDATLVDSWWEYRSAKSLPLIRRRIHLDLQADGAGACLGMEINGRLVASIMRYEGGALGMLYVDPAFRRRGYAKTLLEQATFTLKQRGEERVAFIVDGNQASEKVFEAVGWERADPHKKRKTGKRRAKRKWIHKGD